MQGPKRTPTPCSFKHPQRNFIHVTLQAGSTQVLLADRPDRSWGSALLRPPPWEAGGAAGRVRASPAPDSAPERAWPAKGDRARFASPRLPAFNRRESSALSHQPPLPCRPQDRADERPHRQPAPRRPSAQSDSAPRSMRAGWTAPARCRADRRWGRAVDATRSGAAAG